MNDFDDQPSLMSEAKPSSEIQLKLEQEDNLKLKFLRSLAIVTSE